MNSKEYWSAVERAVREWQITNQKTIHPLVRWDIEQSLKAKYSL
jgi:hypothetical protein